MLQPCQEFLEIAYALSTACRIPVSIVIIVFLIKCAFKTRPFILGEQAAEVAETQIVGLVSAEAPGNKSVSGAFLAQRRCLLFYLLHGIRVVEGQIEP